MTHCVGCGRQVPDADLQRGRAFRFSRGLLCLSCSLRRPDCLSREQREFLHKLMRPTPAPRPSTRRAAARPSSGRRTLGTAGIAAVLLAVAVLGMAAGGRTRGSRSAQSPAPAPVPGTQREEVRGQASPESPAPAPLREEPWQLLCDGSSVAFLRGSCRDVWRAERGAIQPVPGAAHAAQTLREFADDEVRVRFEVSESAAVLFSIRQGADGKFNVSVPGDAAVTGPRELVFRCREDGVTATLDGRAVPVEAQGRPRFGCLQFNVQGGSLRILSIHFRPTQSASGV